MIAEKENPEIRKERISEDIKRLEEKRKLKAFLPTVSLSIDEDDAPYDDNLDPFDNSVGTQAYVRMPLFTGGKLTSEYKKSKIDTQRTELSNVLLKYDIREDVIKKYFEVLNNRKQVEILDGVNTTLTKQLERLEGLYKNNKLVRKSDVLRVKSDILTNEVVLLRAKQRMEISTYELQILLGISMDERVDVAEFEYKPMELENFLLEDDIHKALNEGSKVELSKLDLESKELDVTIARSAYYPQVGIGFEKDFKREKDGLDSYRIGVGFRWNVFRWGSDMDGVSQRKYMVEQANIDLKTKEDEVILELKEKYSDMMTLSKQVEAQQLKAEIATENAKIDTLRYNNSLMSSFEYLDSIDKLREAEEGYYTLQRELLLSVDTYVNAGR